MVGWVRATSICGRSPSTTARMFRAPRRAHPGRIARGVAGRQLVAGWRFQGHLGVGGRRTVRGAARAAPVRRVRRTPSSGIARSMPPAARRSPAPAGRPATADGEGRVEPDRRVLLLDRPLHRTGRSHGPTAGRAPSVADRGPHGPRRCGVRDPVGLAVLAPLRAGRRCPGSGGSGHRDHAGLVDDRGAIAAARENARSIRDQLSGEVFEALNATHIAPSRGMVFAASPGVALQRVMERLLVVNGVINGPCRGTRVPVPRPRSIPRTDRHDVSTARGAPTSCGRRAGRWPRYARRGTRRLPAHQTSHRRRFGAALSGAGRRLPAVDAGMCRIRRAAVRGLEQIDASDGATCCARWACCGRNWSTPSIRLPRKSTFWRAAPSSPRCAPATVPPAASSIRPARSCGVTDGRAATADHPPIGYRYVTDVHASFNEVRMTPAEVGGQLLLNHELQIDPRGWCTPTRTTGERRSRRSTSTPRTGSLRSWRCPRSRPRRSSLGPGSPGMSCG